MQLIYCLAFTLAFFCSDVRSYSTGPPPETTMSPDSTGSPPATTMSPDSTVCPNFPEKVPVWTNHTVKVPNQDCSRKGSCTVEDCQAAVNALGTKYGHDWTNVNVTVGWYKWVKGCYAYKRTKFGGQAFFGTKPTASETVPAEGKHWFRPEGYEGYHEVEETRQEACSDHPVEACKCAVNALGTKYGHDWTNVNVTVGWYKWVKGCYAYKRTKFGGQAFFGTKPTASETVPAENKHWFRPEGYDCQSTTA